MRKTLFVAVTFVLFVKVFVFAVIKEGKPAPSFQTTLLDGRTVVVQTDKGKLSLHIKDRKGNQTLNPKVLVLDFWATWCPPCQITSQWLKQLHSKYSKKGMVILAISVDEDGRNSVEPFAREEKTPYLIALDPKGKVANRFKVEGLPTIFVINQKGVIVQILIGMPSGMKELEHALQNAGIH